MPQTPIDDKRTLTSPPRNLPSRRSHTPVIQHGLKWKSELFGPVPKWAIEPSSSAMLSVARQYLPNGGVDSISFLSGGAFNKLYSIHGKTLTSEYLLRVSLPVCPFYKTASEVATLEYVRRHTTIPVPRVLAHSSDAHATDNPVGFEWIIMSRMSGIPLAENLTSAEMPLAAKFALAEQVGQLARQLENLSFPAIGSLYFTSELQDGGILVEHDPDFCVGPIVDTAYYIANRITLPSNTGPFTTELEWIQSQLDIQQEVLANPYSAPDDSDHSDSDSDDDDDGPEQIEALQRLRKVAAEMFSPTPVLSIIHYHDLSAENLLVDPDSYTLTAWVDWENIVVAPAWSTRAEPHFLRGLDYVEEELEWTIPATLQPEKGDDESALHVKKVTLLYQLREKFHKALGTGKETEEEGVEMRKFLEMLECLEISVARVQSWLRDD